jgi:hypothetical protein
MNRGRGRGGRVQAAPTGRGSYRHKKTEEEEDLREEEEELDQDEDEEEMENGGEGEDGEEEEEEDQAARLVRSTTYKYIADPNLLNLHLFCICSVRTWQAFLSKFFRYGRNFAKPVCVARCQLAKPDLQI